MQTISFASIADAEVKYPIHVITHSAAVPHKWGGTLSWTPSFLQNLLDAQTDANFLSVGDGKMTPSITDISREVLGRLPCTICLFPQKHYFQYLLKVKQQGHYVFQNTAMGRDELKELKMLYL